VQAHGSNGSQPVRSVRRRQREAANNEAEIAAE
jgi:hypothetical protein